MNTPPRTHQSSSPSHAGQPGGFTLIELLAVIAIMGVIMALTVSMMNSFKGSADVTNAAFLIKGSLDQARTYAIANNTPVWVGFFEEDGARASTTPALPGSGRVVIATVASKNGTRGYDPANPPAKLDSANLVALDKLQKIDGLHLSSLNGASPQSPVPTTGGMARPVIKFNDYDLGNASCISSTTFSWPLQGTIQYTFSKVISFDPQGAARIQYASNGDFIPLYLEIGLQSAHGNLLPMAPSDQTKGNHAALQIDGMTGATRIFRP